MRLISHPQGRVPLCLPSLAAGSSPNWRGGPAEQGRAERAALPRRRAAAVDRRRAAEPLTSAASALCSVYPPARLPAPRCGRSFGPQDAVLAAPAEDRGGRGAGGELGRSRHLSPRSPRPSQTPFPPQGPVVECSPRCRPRLSLPAGPPLQRVPRLTLCSPLSFSLSRSASSPRAGPPGQGRPDGGVIPGFGTLRAR